MIQEAQRFWDAIKGKVRQLCLQETENALRVQRYTVTTAPDGTVMGVTLPYGTTELFLPYSNEVSTASVGDVVLVVWWRSMSNAKVYFFANGYVGSSGGGGGGTSDYSDLTNKPQINSVTLTGNKTASQLGLGTYSLPSGGIPATDLASAVQTSLGKADTALQSYTETDPTVPSWAKAVSKPTYTASEVGAAPAVTEATVSAAGDVTQALDANKIYHFTGALTSLTITLNAAGTGIVPQYHFDFDSGSTAPTVTLPNSVTMQGGTFTPEASKHYEVDILNGYGVSMAW